MIALTTSRTFVVLGRPPPDSGRTKGAINSHWESVKSVA